MEEKNTLPKHLPEALARYIALQIEIDLLRKTNPELDQLIKAMNGSVDWQEVRASFL